MAESSSRIDQAAALHRQAEATVAAAAAVLDGQAPAAGDPREQHALAEELRAAASALAPGWLGAPLEARSANTPLGGAGLPQFVRVGVAQPLDDATFPAIVPLLGSGNLTIDQDARDARVAGLLRSVVLRLLAAAPAGSLLLRAVDCAGGGTVFAPFEPLIGTGVLNPVATDQEGLRETLNDAQKWVRARRGDGARRSRRDKVMLLVIASLPPTAWGELPQIALLAQQGPSVGLHLIVAGWPPPPENTGDSQQGMLRDATAIALLNPDVRIGNTPLGAFTAGVDGFFDVPVFLDDDPPPHLIDAVCQELAASSAQAAQVMLSDLLPDPREEIWTADAADGLSTPVGQAGDNPVVLQFNDLTPHWMVGGRSGAGKTAFLINVLYGLCARFSPAELALYLLDFKEGVSFAEFVPTQRDRTWLPHARAVGVESDREYGLAVLRELDAEMTRRSVAYKRAGVTKFADLRAVAAEEGRGKALPRVLCVIDEFQVLLAGNDPIATEAVGLLESLARKGRSYGIHLVLASQTVLGVEALYTKRDSIFGQFPVRVALPGGGDVLEPTNDSAAGLALGTAVVNTAGGLGGPRGATRAHERHVRFPDPHADKDALSELRHKLWGARDPESPPPRIFAGYAQQHLADDPTYRAALAGRAGRPAALVGRVIDVQLSTASFPLDASPGRHLAIFGTRPDGAEVLQAAALGVAAFHAPRTARFVISSLVAEGDELANDLAAEIGHRQEVVAVGASGLAAQLNLERPSYLVVFGMDAASPGTLPTLRQVLRDGPGRGVHLLSWWRGLRRFTEETGGSAGREDVAGLLFLNTAQQDVCLMLGRQIDWQPRPNRALLHDRHADRVDVLVPFVLPEAEEP
ncbi:FtsK/SpoIIIE domain-containing protein [Actinoplanes sp. NPDC049265]|uniref:FtsK/SpoIIIE domain-containing protein n=1 Tax=Actinoplanes sp. NPDC049265 TaxID=3363902 RepID=UPI003722B24C